MPKDRGRKRWRVRLTRVSWAWLGVMSLTAGGTLGALALRPLWADIAVGIGRWWPALSAVILLGAGVAAMHRRTMIGAGNTRRTRTLDNGSRGTDSAVERSNLSGWIVLAAAAGVLGVAGLVLAMLWDWSAAPGLGAKDAASTRIETVKIAASVAVAGGGLFALYLAARRQRTQELELAQRRDEFAHSEHDATERRVTELYTKAVEQLGSDKAVVRQGGLYALERVAHDNPAHRQTVINVICAYLRTPYHTPPDRTAARRTGLTARPLRRISANRVTASAAARRISLNPPTAMPTHEELRQEREVRLTAQRILSAHLHPDIDPDTGHATNPRYWPEGYDIDLTGATLIDLNLTGCHIDVASFQGATFSGGAWFGGATFSSDAEFSGATFSSDAEFGGATFYSDAGFHGATFSSDAGFNGATFYSYAGFSGATFSSGAWFRDATLSSDAGFSDATFSSYAGFRNATFSSGAWFRDATFSSDAEFGGATFSSYAEFRNATFSGDAGFRDAMFVSVAGAHGACARVDLATDEGTWPAGWTVDLSAGVPMDDRDGNWAKLVPVPIVLAPPPAELAAIE